MITRHQRGVVFLITGWIGAGIFFYMVYNFPQFFSKISLFIGMIGLIMLFSHILYQHGRGN